MTRRRRVPNKQAFVARLRAAWRALGDAKASHMQEAAEAYERAVAAAVDPSQIDSTLIMVGPGMYITADGVYEVSRTAGGDGWDLYPRGDLRSADRYDTLDEVRAVFKAKK